MFIIHECPKDIKRSLLKFANFVTPVLFLPYIPGYCMGRSTEIYQIPSDVNRAYRIHYRDHLGHLSLKVDGTFIYNIIFSFDKYMGHVVHFELTVLQNFEVNNIKIENFETVNKSSIKDCDFNKNVLRSWGGVRFYNSINKSKRLPVGHTRREADHPIDRLRWSQDQLTYYEPQVLNDYRILDKNLFDLNLDWELVIHKIIGFIFQSLDKFYITRTTE